MVKPRTRTRQLVSAGIGLVAAALVVTTTVTANSGPASGSTGKGALKLVAASDTVEVEAWGGEAFVQPSVWLAAYDAAFEFRATQSSYDKPVKLTKTVIRGKKRTTTTAPASIVDSMKGFKNGLRVTLKNKSGKVILDERRPLCPGGYDRQRVQTDGATGPVYPEFCGGNWFTKGILYGIERGMAVPTVSDLGFQTKGETELIMTMSIDKPVADFLGLSKSNRTAKQNLVIVDQCPDGNCEGEGEEGVGMGAMAADGAHGAHDQGARTVVPRERLEGGENGRGRLPLGGARGEIKPGKPKKDTLPDLISLPAWQISTEVDEGGTDRLNFAANEWNAGPGPMIVEGFRRGTAPVMDAYQMFYRDGEQVGVKRTGTMEFHEAPEHNHWHFLDFAKYELVDAKDKVVSTSGKQSWCLAPTDPVDLTVPGATLRPGQTGLESACGAKSALWLRESMPTGWGDTYDQSQTQAFDLRKVKNGTYRIKVTVNPDGNLYERTRSNNVSYRTVTIGGKAGARTVKVPPYQGVDTETWWNEEE
ncbi:Lysyl oxidase [Nocardioides sp. YR527]|uniref:lysyl oxidase family protein n=1 Tax=Nocardioides sp. YR527 TaxID=1881028 RepID=UPI00087E2084|nr:lysyl oxidase family protein [Nocardioides sp. YR527]SDK79232.1 Lysyl oxidase [Nocardioides sp. YR527]